MFLSRNDSWLGVPVRPASCRPVRVGLGLQMGLENWMEQENPWTFMNAAVEAGVPSIGELGKNVLFWARALNLQYRRLLQNIPGNLDQVQQYSLERAIDHHFFAATLFDLYKTCKVVAENLKDESLREEAVRAVTNFSDAMPNFEKVRHIREHPEDYLLGKGRLQERGLMNPKKWDITYRLSRLGSAARPWDYSVSIAGFELQVGRAYDEARATVEGVMAALQTAITSAAKESRDSNH